MSSHKFTNFIWDGNWNRRCFSFWLFDFCRNSESFRSFEWTKTDTNYQLIVSRNLQTTQSSFLHQESWKIWWKTHSFATIIRISYVRKRSRKMLLLSVSFIFGENRVEKQSFWFNIQWIFFIILEEIKEDKNQIIPNWRFILRPVIKI